MKLHKFTEIPAGFLDLDPRDLHTILPGPSIIELKGKKESPLFVSTLLHGNETSGIYALQKILQRYFASNEELPRSLIIFVGNLPAAKEGQRKVDGQLDYNRIWASGNAPEHQMAEEVKCFVQNRKPFACIDIHNCTGLHPYYACINSLETPFLNMAKLFSRHVVYFIRPNEVLSIAFKEFAPAITLECGQSGDLAGIQRAADFLETVLNLDEIPTSAVSNDDIDIFHSVGVIKVPKDCSLSFDQTSSADFCFVPNFENLNFRELSEHTLLGWRNNANHTLIVVDETGDNASNDFIVYKDNEIRTKRPVIPCMFCTSETIIRQDCLGYFMQRYRLN